MPTLFISHGSPDILLRGDPVLEEWKSLAQTIPRPDAILLTSAHFITQAITFGGNHQQRTLYDFSGFSPELYEYRYSPPSGVELANALEKSLVNDLGPEIKFKTDHERGLDHGAWVLLLVMYPQADIPVMQMSISSNLSADKHYELGKILKSVLPENTLILASGGIVHDFGKLDFQDYMRGADEWALDFMDTIKTQINSEDFVERKRSLTDINFIQNGMTSLSSLDHCLPFVISAGAAEGEKANFLAEQWRFGNLSMNAIHYESSANVVIKKGINKRAKSNKFELIEN